MRRSLLLLCLLWCVAACGTGLGGTPTAPAKLFAETPNAEPSSGYPAPNPAAPQTGYPGTDIAATEAVLRTPQPPMEAPEPVAGRASLSGVLYSYSINRVVPGTMFYLTRGTGEDGRQLNPLVRGPSVSTDIVAYSDDRGQFVLNAISPGVYFLIVNAPYNWVEAEEKPNAGEAWLIELKADERRALGVVHLAWP